ncbi:MAG: hypothetical protein E7363_01590 [Clostridiales bacterium]|nr:hypothetical protein [Clostridiales bacterium]
MGKEKNDFVKFCSFFALLLAALLIFIYNVLPEIGITMQGKLLGILSLVKDIALLLGIAFAAYAYADNKGKGWRITFWIALVLYLGAAVFGIF